MEKHEFEPPFRYTRPKTEGAPESGEYPCGGVTGVAVAWFVAGLFIGLLGLVLWIR